GKFYGATGTGGVLKNGLCFDAGCGTVFKITSSGAFTTLHSFDQADGEAPSELIQGDDGNFYGATEAAGTRGFGTIFRIPTAGVFTSLHSFDSTDGSGLNGLLTIQQGADGNFYGTAGLGGTSGRCSGGCGTVFKITPVGVFTLLHSFDSADGSGPAGL